MLKKQKFKSIIVFILNSLLLILLYLTELNKNINSNFEFTILLVIVFFIQLYIFINKIRKKSTLKKKIKKKIYINFKSIIWASLGIIFSILFIYISNTKNIFLKIFILLIALELIIDVLIDSESKAFYSNKNKDIKNNKIIRVTGNLGNKKLFFEALVSCSIITWALALVPSIFLHLHSYIWLNSIIICAICFLVGIVPMYYLDLLFKNFVVIECVCTKRELSRYSRGKNEAYWLQNDKNNINLVLGANIYTYNEGDKVIVVMGILSKFIFDSYRKDIATRLNIDIDLYL